MISSFIVSGMDNSGVRIAPPVRYILIHLSDCNGVDVVDFYLDDARAAERKYIGGKICMPHLARQTRDPARRPISGRLSSLSSPSQVNPSPVLPMICEISRPRGETQSPPTLWSSTPAWDPSSRTPDHQTRAPTPPVPALPDHPLLQTHLLDVKVQAKVVSGGLNLAKTFVSGSMYQGRPKIMYKSHKTTSPLEPNWITVLHPNVKQTDALLVSLEGEYAERFALRICHTYCGLQAMALVGIVDRVADMRPNQTGIEVHLPAEHLGIAQETNEDSRLVRISSSSILLLTY
jgi:hypothetical protein